jgi:thiol-disulfide isomerase/thioredoxin
MGMNRWLTCAVGFLVMMLLVGGSFRPQATGRASRPEVGYPAPDFSVPDVEGQPVRLSDFQGKPVFLNFWATWCPPCKAEMPEIQKLHQQTPELVVLGVDLGQTEASPQAVAAFMRSNGYSWRVPFDADGAVSNAYGVISIPTSFFIDRSGVVQAKYVGPMSLPLMQALSSRVMGR